ncbi:MAG TPA: hypothetical protein VME21_06030 [Steroidobacteraceae bacterium]|nr:hypothetical protein [Steroidobacteraceae bacterium]
MHSELLRYLPLLIACVLLIRRTQRPRVLRVATLWIRPTIVLCVVALYVFGAIHSHARLDEAGIAIVLAALAGGAVIGALRAHAIHLTRNSDTGLIEARLTTWGLLIIIGWILARMALRQSGWAGATAPFGVVSVAFMALLVGTVTAQAIMLARRCKALA